MNNVKIYLASLLFVPAGLYGQAGGGIVYDPQVHAAVVQSNINSANNLTEAVSHTKLLNETLTFWKDSQTLLQKVSGALNTISYVRNLVQHEIDMISRCSDYTSQIRSMKYLTPEEMSFYCNQLNLVLSNTRDLLAFARDILKDNTFKMNDSERIGAITKVTEDLDKQSAILSYSFHRAENTDKNRAIKSLFQPC